MKVAYIYSESGSMRIPFIGADIPMFNRLAALGGKWNQLGHEFIFGKAMTASCFSREFPGIPFVWVNGNAPSPVRVYGFLERPWGKPTQSGEIKTGQANVQPILPDKLSEHWRKKLEAKLRSRKYSQRTLDAYLYNVRLLCRTLQKTPEEIQPDDVTDFLADLEKNKAYSASSINLAISGIKFFYKEVYKYKSILDQRRPRQDKRLPVVLSQAEIKKILAAEKNLKHRLLLMLVYASGLRVSEAVNLKCHDVDIDRKLVNIISGKGRKGRCTIMSETSIDTLINYCSQYETVNWLFPGVNPARHLSIRTAQRICELAFKKAGIKKNASIHSLRHSFATHLLESGTDIRYIKELLGHKSIRTTERYTHVARGKINRIVSPLDNIDRED